MALKVWLPLNGDLHNQGCSNVIATENNLTSNATGKIGSCYNFNGSSSYINLNTALLNSSTKEFSYCCWVKFNVLNKNQCLFSNRTKVGQTGFSIIYITPNKFYFDAGSRLTITVPITLVTGQWYHFTFTFKNSDSTIDKRAYINGEEMINAGGSVPDALANATQSFIGASQNSSTTVSDNYLNGSLNDVRIYDHCLSATEVRKISQGLVLHYKLDKPANINNNLYVGSEKFTGSWGNTSNWTTSTETYQNFVVKQRSGTWSGLYQNIPCTNGDIFTISFYAKVDSGGQIMSIHRSNLGNVTTGLSILGGNFSSGTNWIITTQDGTQWNRYWATVQIASADITYLQWRIENNQSGKNLYICGIKLEKGTVATPWSPAASEAGETNIIQDSSGYNHNGTILGNPIISSDTARYISSTSFPANADGILSTYPLTLWNNAFTYSFWIKPSGENGGRSIYAASYSGTSCSIEKTTGNKLRFYWNGSPDLSTSSLTITDGIWQHIAIVKEESKTTVKCYYNGVLKDTFTNTFSDKTFSGNLRIARDTRGDATSYTGLMSDFRIYCTALEADAIRQLYEVGAKVDNKQNLHTFELAELNSGKELINTYLTPSYANHTTIWNDYDENGEITLIGNSQLGSPYIKVNPVNKKYIFDAEVSIDANNQVFIGFQRYDAAKTTRQNDATLYAVNIKPSSSQKHKHYHFVYNTNFNSFDANTPIDTISLRVLNDWSNEANRKMIIHKMSFREVSIIEPSKINKKGQVITDELMEMNKYTRIQKDGIVETKQLIEL